MAIVRKLLRYTNISHNLDETELREVPMSHILRLVPIAVIFGAIGLAGHPADAGQRYADRVQLPVILAPGAFMNSPTVGDLNGDGIDDVIFVAVSENPAENGPVTILLSDGAGSYIDGTSTMIAGPIPMISVARRILIEDFNGDGQLDIYFDNHGTEDPCCTVFGEKNRLLLSEADGKLRDVTAAKLPSITTKCRARTSCCNCYS